jgi:CRP/FNR family transcriptional regulator, cyclic AMP receptor protein
MSQRNGPVKSEIVRLMAGHTGYFEGMASATQNSVSSKNMQNISSEKNGNFHVSNSEISQIPHQAFTFAEGTLIFKEKEKPKGIYILKSGCVKLYVNRENSRGRTTTSEYVVRLVAAGEYFGYNDMIENRFLSATAEAVQPSVVWFYEINSIMQLLGNLNPLVRELLQQSVGQVNNFEKTGQFNYLASVQERIAYRLLELSDRFGIKQGNGVSLNLKLTRNELAQLASTINESLSRHLTEFKNEGLIDINGKEIIILNREGLVAKSGNI